MSSKSLNNLYAAYCADAEKCRDQLLKAILATSLKVFAWLNAPKPDELAQEFTIDVWEHLPTLRINTSFSAWLNRRMRFTAGKSFRKQKTDIVTVVNDRPRHCDEDGEEITHDEELERLDFETLSDPGQVLDVPPFCA